MKQTSFLLWWRTFAPGLALGDAVVRFERAVSR